MAQDPHLDPRTGEWHADPMWRRYAPPFRSSDINLPPDPPKPPPLNTYRWPEMGQHPSGLEPPDYSTDEGEDVPESPGFPYSPSQNVLQDEPRPDQHAALASLLGMGNPGADKISGRMLQEDRLHEMKRNREIMAENPIKGSMYVGGMQSDIEDLQDDMNRDPDFGLMEQGRVADYTKRLHAANLGGFETPQAEAARTQRLEEEKLRQPIEAEKVRGEYALRGEREKAEATQRLQDTAPVGEYYKALSRTLGLGGESPATSSPLKSISKSGVTFANPQKANPTWYTRLDAARKQLLATQLIAGRGGDPALRAEIDQLERRIAAEEGLGAGTTPADDAADIDEFADSLMQNVDTKNLSWAQLQPWLTDPNLTPAHKAMLKEVLMRKRGF